MISDSEFDPKFGKKIIGLFNKNPEIYFSLGCQAVILNGLSSQNVQFKMLSGDEMDTIEELAMVIAIHLPDELDNLDRTVIKTPAFDLFFYLEHFTHSAKNACEHKVGKEMDEFIYTMMGAVFRMWYEEFSKEDFIAYFEGHPEREFPSLANSADNFKWAQDNGILCSDLQSLNAPGQKLTAQEEIDAYGMMDDICTVFDHLKPIVTEYTGVPMEFIDSHIKTCHDLYMVTTALYQMIPQSVDIDDIVYSPEKMDKLYDSFTKTIASKELLKELRRDGHEDWYKRIFEACFTICNAMEENKTGFFAEGRGEIYKQATKHRSRK